MKDNLAYLSTVALTFLVGFTVAFGLAQLVPITFLYQYTYYANLAGYAALILIIATGVIMLFKRAILRRMKDPGLLRTVHIVVAGLAGVFLVFHVVFFLLFPLSIPVLFGYVATYAALAIWITGTFYFEGLRNSMFYHGLLSLVGIALMAVHVFSAGRTLPDDVAGVVLVMMACSVLAIAVKRFTELPTADKRSY